MKVLLVRNYQHDGSVSMRVFADLLCRELRAKGVDVREVAPKARFGDILPSANGVGKWLGYIDRYLLFPPALKRAAAGADVIHICDHGNAMYAKTVRNSPVLVTCHDLLAVRGALGEVDDCRSSFFGRFLQKWIVSGLRKATRVACVSQFTFGDAARVLESTQNLCNVINGLAYPFRVLESCEAKRRLAAITNLREPFILHVGSDQARKNREGAVRVFAEVRAQLNVQLVLAGGAPGPRLLGLIEALGIRDHVLFLTRPATEIIEALYNRALVFLFPSRYEGFGWPPIEAQACGCPVVASSIEPIAEVLGTSAETFAVEDEAGMADAILRLARDHGYREQMRQRGFANVRTRFETSRMIDEYLELYQEISCPN